MNHRYLDVQLASKNEKKFTLRYQIRQHEVGAIWAACLEKANAYGLKETDRFSGFADRSSQLLVRLQATITELKKIHPLLKFPEISATHLQESINRLHTNFAHSHLVEQLITPENTNLWTEFKVLLHALESHTKEANARIVFTWNEKNRVEIPSHLYPEFNIGLEFGHAYFNYAQVGRQIHEIFYAKDKQVPPEHIQPARFFSADTFLWFGQNFAEKELKIKMENWFTKNEFNFNWKDPQLAIGQVTVARLAEMPASEDEKLKFIEKISEFDHILSVNLS